MAAHRKHPAHALLNLSRELSSSKSQFYDWMEGDPVTIDQIAEGFERREVGG